MEKGSTMSFGISCHQSRRSWNTFVSFLFILDESKEGKQAIEKCGAEEKWKEEKKEKKEWIERNREREIPMENLNSKKEKKSFGKQKMNKYETASSKDKRVFKLNNKQFYLKRKTSKRTKNRRT